MHPKTMNWVIPHDWAQYPDRPYGLKILRADEDETKFQLVPVVSGGDPSIVRGGV